MEGENGVIRISQEVVDNSNRVKNSKKKTLAQLPVYRAVANLKFLITDIMMHAPNKLLKFFDQMLVNASEAKKSVGMADISRNAADRAWYLDCARVIIQDLSEDIATIRRMEVISKDEEKKLRSLVKSITAQLIAWRDYTNNEGANRNQTNGRV